MPVREALAHAELVADTISDVDGYRVRAAQTVSQGVCGPPGTIGPDTIAGDGTSRRLLRRVIPECCQSLIVVAGSSGNEDPGESDEAGNTDEDCADAT